MVLLMSSHMASKPTARVPICRTNKVKTNCDSKSWTFLWTIRRLPLGADGAESLKRGPVSYFFGTIHVPYSRVWDSIPNRVKLAFKTSDQIFFELDLMDAHTVSTLTACQLLPDGRKLVDILPKNLYKRLRRHLDYIRRTIPNWVTPDQKARGLYAEYLFNAITANWERKRPVWVMLMINSLNEVDIKSRGIPVLDLFLAQEAKRLNKKIGSVEKVEEQCTPLNGLNYSQVVFALDQTLQQHENIRRGRSHARVTTNDLIQHYNCGDLNEEIFNYDSSRFLNLWNSSTDSESEQMAKHIDDYFRSELIVKRNERMSRRAVDVVNDNPNRSHFFAFGAGHFFGHSSILQYFKAMGFEVKRVSDNRKARSGCRVQRHKQIPQPRVEAIASQLNDEGVGRSQDSQRFNLMSSSDRNNDDTNPEINKNRFVVSTNSPQNDGSDRSTHRLIPSSVKSRGLEWETSEVLSDGYTRPVRPVSTTSAPKQANRRFNDLWLPLQTVPISGDSLSIPQQMPEDVHILRDYLHVWVSNGTSRPTGTPSASHSIASLLFVYIFVKSTHLWSRLMRLP